MPLGRRLLAFAWIAGLVGCSGSHAAATDAGADSRAFDAGAPSRDANPDSRRSPDAGRTRDAARPHDAARLDDAPEPNDAARRDASPLDAPPRTDALDAVAVGADAVADGGPTATLLSLSLPLVPAFSTSIHDYYVRCPADVNAITVSMTAATGSTIALLQPLTTPPAVESVVSLSVGAGAAIVVGVTPDGADGSVATEYWVRCLPPPSRGCR